MKQSKEYWLAEGYRLFAETGAKIPVEVLARRVGVTKSSFYHHFADVDVFIDALLQHHIQQITVLAEKERNCANIDPELVDVLLAHREDVLFNRTLRVHRDEARYLACYQRTSQLMREAFVTLGLRELGATLTRSGVEALFGLALDNFLLQITPGNYSRAWLLQYFNELKTQVVAIAEGKPILDGGV